MKDPEYNHKRSARQAVAMTEELIEKKRANGRVSVQNIYADPARLALHRDYQRKWKKARRELVQSDPTEHESELAKVRDYNREWAAEKRKNMTPEQKMAVKERNRERQRVKSLNELFGLGAKIGTEYDGRK